MFSYLWMPFTTVLQQETAAEALGYTTYLLADWYKKTFYADFGAGVC